MAGEQRLRELEAVVEQHGHAVARAHAAGGERARDPRRAIVQLGVRALHAAEDERRAIRVRGGAPLEQLAQVLRTVHALTPGAP